MHNSKMISDITFLEDKEAFAKILVDCINETNGKSDATHLLSLKKMEIYTRIKGNCVISYDAVKEYLSEKTVLNTIIQQYSQQGSTEKLHVITCPDYVEEIADILRFEFQEVYFYDAAKQGQTIGKTCTSEILPPKILEESNIENDIVIIATSTEKIIEHYFFSPKLIDHKNLLLLNEIQHLVRNLTRDEDYLTGFIEKLNEENGILYVSNSITSTIAPLLEEVNKHDKIFWIHKDAIISETSYQGIKSDSIKVENSRHLSFSEIIHVLRHSQNERILLNAESFINPFWDTEISCYTYILATALIRFTHIFKSDISKQEISLLLYDSIKPVSEKLDWGRVVELTYKEMISQADKIILNASVESFGEFLENTTHKSVQYVSALRHTYLPERKKSRLSEGIHIAVISTYIGEFYEPSRSPARPYVALALEQGFHIHYYTDTRVLKNGLESFISELSIDARKRFHVHQPILNQKELVEELQVYNLGWIIYNTHIFSDMISKVDNQFCKDIFDMYAMTSLPTTCLTLGAAAVPILTNRSASGIISQFHQDAVITVEFSEVENLKNLITQDVLNKAQLAAEKDQHMFDVSKRTPKLVEFLNI